MLKERIAADLLRYGEMRDRCTFAFALRTLLVEPGAVAGLLYRAQQRLTENAHNRLAFVMRSFNYYLTGVDISPGAQIEPGVKFVHPSSVVIGAGVRCGRGLTVLQGVTMGRLSLEGPGPDQYPWVGRDVTLGARSSILGPVRVGNGAVVAAHALVLSPVPDGHIAKGAPAQMHAGRQ